MIWTKNKKTVVLGRVLGMLISIVNYSQIDKSLLRLEPSNIAPFWIHMDVRCYSRKYLDEKYFVKSLADNL